MITAHPNDKAMIEKHYKDLERVSFSTIQPDLPNLCRSGTKEETSVRTLLRSALSSSSGEGERRATARNMMGKVTSNDYQILIVDAYIDNTNQQADLFGYKRGMNHFLTGPFCLT